MQRTHRSPRGLRVRARLASAVAALAVGALAPVAAQALTDGITLLQGQWTPGAQPDANSVLFEGPDGLVLLDTGRHVEHVQRLIEAVRTRGKPLRWIVNSHWHLDHIGGNAELRAAFPEARVLASDAILEAQTGFLARYRAQVAERLDALAPSDGQRPALQRELALIDQRAAQTPDDVVRGNAERTLAGRRLLIGLERHAVTAGDVWLRDQQTGVLAAGDLVTLPVPLFDTACPARWARSLDRIAAVRFDWLLPGHGAAMTRAQFERYREGFHALLRCAAGPATTEQCASDWLQAMGDAVPAEGHRLARAYLGYYFENHLRAAPQKAQAHCPATP